MEKNLHVFERADGGATLSDFALRKRMVGIITHQGGQIEGNRKARLPLSEEVMVAAIGLLGCGEAGELPHGPEPAAVHVTVNAASVWEFTWRAQVRGCVKIVEIFGSITCLDLDAADCSDRGIRSIRHLCASRSILAR